MRIYIHTLDDDPHKMENPYVPTLTDSIIEKHHAEFVTRDACFWNDELYSFDIVHLMWPDALVMQNVHPHTIEEVESRLKALKEKNIPLVLTCHNLHSHHMWHDLASKIYDVVYQYADVIIHLAEYSKNLLEKQYPKAKHIVIPHHVYDELYPTMPSRNEALNKLGLPDRQYAICLGAFRNQKEKDLFLKIADCFRKHQIYCIAPSFMDIPKGKINKRWVKQRLKYVYWKLKHPNIVIGAGYIPDELIPYYYAVSDISIIQRLNILNSGNVPLGMYFGNVILGPNVGNMNAILKEMNNPTFDVDDFETIDSACKAAIVAVQQNRGEKNRDYSKKHWATAIVAEELYQLYDSLVESKKK